MVTIHSMQKVAKLPSLFTDANFQISRMLLKYFSTNLLLLSRHASLNLHNAFPSSSYYNHRSPGLFVNSGFLLGTVLIIDIY